MRDPSVNGGPTDSHQTANVFQSQQGTTFDEYDPNAQIQQLLEQKLSPLEQRKDVSSILCKRPFFFLAPQAFWAVGKWKSWFWISTFPWPTLNSSFCFFRFRLGTTGFSLGPV